MRAFLKWPVFLVGLIVVLALAGLLLPKSCSDQGNQDVNPSTDPTKVSRFNAAVASDTNGAVSSTDAMDTARQVCELLDLGRTRREIPQFVSQHPLYPNDAETSNILAKDTLRFLC